MAIGNTWNVILLPGFEPGLFAMICSFATQFGLAPFRILGARHRMFVCFERYPELSLVVDISNTYVAHKMTTVDVM
jgi:hypothetical protein